jgi:hypothetical protein
VGGSGGREIATCGRYASFKQYTARRRRVLASPSCSVVMIEWCTSSFCSPRKWVDTAFSEYDESL